MSGPWILALMGAVVTASALGVLWAEHLRLRRLRKEYAQLARWAEERATALDYIVRARVVDYVYDYVGYRITLGGTWDEVERVMVFAPPRNKDIICKRITLVEGQRLPPGMSLAHFHFRASVFAPLPSLVDEEAETVLDPWDETAWRFESQPWVLEMMPEETGEARVILVFTPMISDTRRLLMRYRWPRVFPGLAEGLASPGHFSILKQAKTLEFTVRFPAPAPPATLTIVPPGGQAVRSQVTEQGVVCTIPHAPRGVYHYTLELHAPWRPPRPSDPLPTRA